MDELVGLEPTRLAALYAAGKVPALADLAGDLRGRMLAWYGVGGAMAALLRALGAWDRFPWHGKTFASGEGANRVLLDRLRVCRFSMAVGPSRAGAFDALHLDYDRPGNPFFVRALHEELRELRPGLLLGQLHLVRPLAPRLLLFSGLERAAAP